MAKKTNADFEFGHIEITTVKEVPASRRGGGAKSSSFPFAKLAAPSKDGIATFTVPFKGGDEKKFRRSIQSAATQANKFGRANGKYFETRSVTDDGKFAGITVYRTDAPRSGD